MKSSKRVSVKPEVVVDHRSFMRTDMSNAKDSALLHVQQGEPVFGKNLEIPRTNSSMSQERLIQTALRDIAKLPEKIEQSVSLKVAEPAYQKAVLSKAVKKLNVPKSFRVYHDLPNIEDLPSISIKRTTFEQKRLDPSPSIEDYNKPEWIRSNPPHVFPLPLQSKKENIEKTVVELDVNFNQNDALLLYERIYDSI